jgi:hypothetical protein
MKLHRDEGDGVVLLAAAVVLLIVRSSQTIIVIACFMIQAHQRRCKDKLKI